MGNMEEKTLEGVRLQNFTLTLNPEDMDVFDKEVGRHNRSREIRNLIRGFNAKRKLDSTGQGSDKGSP
jgi:hypothetical protein